MTPYYDDGIVQIYRGDCREIVPALGRFDLLLTDPPYGIKRSGQASSYAIGGAGTRKRYEKKGWDEERPSAKTFRTIIDAADRHVIWGGNYFADILPAGGKWLVWDKGQRILQSDGELAWTTLSGPLRILTVSRIELYHDGAVHPTQKPKRLMTRCLTQAIDQAPVARVLDPFGGSGTTAVVCKKAGIRCVLIEQDAEFCDIARRRLSQDNLF